MLLSYVGVGVFVGKHYCFMNIVVLEVVWLFSTITVRTRQVVLSEVDMSCNMSESSIVKSNYQLTPWFLSHSPFSYNIYT